MPIYHFNVHDGQDYPDKTGSECAGLAEARIEAVKRISLILQESAPSFWSGAPWHMAVADSTGLTRFTIMFLATNSPLAPAA